MIRRIEPPGYVHKLKALLTNQKIQGRALQLARYIGIMAGLTDYSELILRLYTIWL
ncbi:hypothetical protein D3C87_2043050 [compost metagenome]